MSLYRSLKYDNEKKSYASLLRECDKTSGIQTEQEISEETIVSMVYGPGYCLSPKLFKIYIDRALTGWREKCREMGVQIGDGTIYCLLFADGQVVRRCRPYVSEVSTRF